MFQSIKFLFSLIVICMSLLFSKAQRVIPDDIKHGYSVCVEYVDRYTPETVKNCVKTTVNSLASVLDALDKGAEITSAGVRRFLRDDLGVAQDTAQDVSDVMHAGTQIAISLMPGKAVSFARSLPKLEIVRLAPSGTRASTYRFAFKDIEKSACGVKYRTVTEHNGRIVSTPQQQRLFISKKLKEERVWINDGHKINGNQAYYCKTDGLYYVPVKREKNDIEVWRVSGKKAIHQGAIECNTGRWYEGPKHPDGRYD